MLKVMISDYQNVTFKKIDKKPRSIFLLITADQIGKTFSHKALPWRQPRGWPWLDAGDGSAPRSWPKRPGQT
jgi:hypothetical protein